MQPLLEATTAEECAQSLLDVIPGVMWAIRRQMRKRRANGLTVPQFRAMILIEENPSGCLSAVAEHLGTTLPSTSRLVAGLVAGGLLTRKTDASDRRHCCLALTARGKAALKDARQGTQEYMAGEVASLTPEQRGTLVAASSLLKTAFAQELRQRG
jgi:DNA-binding MarR family transcriptional regulator